MDFFKRVRIPRHDNEPYLDRLIIFRCKWFGLMLHRFVGGDDECIHCHPWAFWSVILRGGYWEVTRRVDPECLVCRGTGRDSGRGYNGLCRPCLTRLQKKWYRPFSTLFRPADWVHRIDIDPARKPVTLVFHWGKERNWGFWTRFGWLWHHDYSYKSHCA